MFLFKKKKAPVTISSFITGSIVDLASVPDEVFSTKAMGDGLTIKLQKLCKKAGITKIAGLTTSTVHGGSVNIQ